MPITYRTLQPHEADALLHLWVTVLEDRFENRQQLFGDFNADPQRFARTQVALTEDGVICGAATY